MATLDAPIDTRYFRTGASRRRFWLAVKVGCAVTLCSLLVLVESADAATQGFGVWAVITAVVIMQPSLGMTLSKGVNRLFGTVIAAAAGSTNDSSPPATDAGRPLTGGA